MKNKLLGLTSIALILLIQCAFAQVPDIAKAGNLISHEKCSAWVNKYSASGGKTPGHMYGSNVLREMISQSNTSGIIIFVGLDGNGTEHLIFKTLDETGNISNTYYATNSGVVCPPMCPKKDISKIGNQIEEGLAQQMIAKFQSTYSERVFATSFSRTIIETILDKNKAAGIYFANGLGDNNEEHLILVGVNEQGDIKWDGDIANGGKPCPTYCPTGIYPQINSATKN